MAKATSSPFTKDDCKNNLAYYFNDDQIGIVEKNTTTGEWDSLSSETQDADGDRLRVHYHARYSPISDLDQDINTDIGLKYGLHLALLDYVRSRLEEDEGNMDKASFYFARFTSRIKKFPYRRSSTRSIQPYNLT